QDRYWPLTPARDHLSAHVSPLPVYSATRAGLLYRLLRPSAHAVRGFLHEAPTEGWSAEHRDRRSLRARTARLYAGPARASRRRRGGPGARRASTCPSAWPP